MKKEKRDRSIIPELKKRAEAVEKNNEDLSNTIAVLKIENLQKKEFIHTIGALLGVFEGAGGIGDFVFTSRMTPPSLGYYDRILLSITKLKEDFAREDEASGVESEKATMLMIALRAALHDPAVPIEEAAKIKFLDMLKDAKDVRPLMDIARSFGVYPIRNERYDGPRF